MNPITSVEELYNFSRGQPSDPPVPPPWGSRRGLLDNVISHLKASPGLTIKQLSARMNFNRNALSSSVKMLTGLPLDLFLKQWRLMLIKEHLKDPRLSYESVANLCGFSSVQAMSKFLDRMIHLTAYEYREGRKNGHRK